MRNPIPTGGWPGNRRERCDWCQEPIHADVPFEHFLVPGWFCSPECAIKRQAYIEDPPTGPLYDKEGNDRS